MITSQKDFFSVVKSRASTLTNALHEFEDLIVSKNNLSFGKFEELRNKLITAFREMHTIDYCGKLNSKSLNKGLIIETSYETCARAYFLIRITQGFYTQTYYANGQEFGIQLTQPNQGLISFIHLVSGYYYILNYHRVFLFDTGITDSERLSSFTKNLKDASELYVNDLKTRYAKIENFMYVDIGKYFYTKINGTYEHMLDLCFDFVYEIANQKDLFSLGRDSFETVNKFLWCYGYVSSLAKDFDNPYLAKYKVSTCSKVPANIIVGLTNIYRIGNLIYDKQVQSGSKLHQILVFEATKIVINNEMLCSQNSQNTTLYNRTIKLTPIEKDNKRPLLDFHARIKNKLNSGENIFADDSEYSLPIKVAKTSTDPASLAVESCTQTIDHFLIIQASAVRQLYLLIYEEMLRKFDLSSLSITHDQSEQAKYLRSKAQAEFAVLIGSPPDKVWLATFSDSYDNVVVTGDTASSVTFDKSELTQELPQRDKEMQLEKAVANTYVQSDNADNPRLSALLLEAVKNADLIKSTIEKIFCITYRHCNQELIFESFEQLVSKQIEYLGFYRDRFIKIKNIIKHIIPESFMEPSPIEEYVEVYVKDFYQKVLIDFNEKRKYSKENISEFFENMEKFLMGKAVVKSYGWSDHLLPGGRIYYCEMNSYENCFKHNKNPEKNQGAQEDDVFRVIDRLKAFNKAASQYYEHRQFQFIQRYLTDIFNQETHILECAKAGLDSRPDFRQILDDFKTIASHSLAMFGHEKTHEIMYHNYKNEMSKDKDGLPDAQDSSCIGLQKELNDTTALFEKIKQLP